MKKMLIVATVQSHVAQFHETIIKEMQKNGYEVHVAAKNNLNEKNGLSLDYVDVVYDVPFERSPFNTKNIQAYKQLKRIINKNNFDIVQCNTPVGGILTRLACRKKRKDGTKVIYTAHGFHFYNGAPKKNWLIYYPIEKIFARMTDVLITINLEDYALAKKKFKCKTEHLYGVGVSDKKYYIHSSQEIELFQSRYNINDEDFNIICIGELNDNKNQIVLIKAVQSMIDTCPHLKVFFAGNGPNEEALKEEINKLQLDNYFTFLGYTRELEYIIPACDCIVSCSKREGLGLNVIEGLLCGKPAIVSNNRGHRELIQEDINGFIFNVGGFLDCAIFLKSIYENKELYGKLCNNARTSVKKYTLDQVIKKQKDIYLMQGE